MKTTDESAPDATLARAAAGFRTTVVSQAVRLVCKVVGVVVLARLVSPADHGVFAMAASLTVLVTLFRDFGLGAAAIQARDLTDGQKTALCRLHVGLGFVLTAATLALAPAAAAFYGEPQLTPLLAVMSIAFVLNGTSAWPRTLLNRDLRFREVNTIETAGAIAGTLAMVGAGMMGAGPYAFAGFLLVSEATMLALAWRANSWRPSAKPDWRGLRALAATGMHLTGYNVLLYGLQQADTLAVGKWFGATPLGLYTRAGQLLVQPVTHLAAPFSQVLMATLARLGADSPFFARQFRATTNAIAHFTLPVAVVCMLLPDEIVRVVLGANWTGAAPLLFWLSISAAAGFLTSTTYALCVSTGNATRLTQLTAFALPVTLLFLWAGRSAGVAGVAAGLAGANLFLLLPRIWWASRGTVVRLRDFMDAFLGPVCVAAVFAAGLALGKLSVASTGVMMRLLIAVLGGIAAILLCALCWPRIRQEFNSLRAHLPLPAKLLALKRTGERPA